VCPAESVEVAAVVKNVQAFLAGVIAFSVLASILEWHSPAGSVSDTHYWVSMLLEEWLALGAGLAAVLWRMSGRP